MSINIRLGDPVYGSYKTVKAPYTNDNADYRLIGRTSKDFLTNKVITDPSNEVAASSLLVNNSPLKINSVGSVGQVLTMIDPTTAAFQDVSAGYATVNYVDTSISNHAALTTTHGVSGTLVGNTDTQTLTNKTIDSGNNTITISNGNNLTGVNINSILDQPVTSADGVTFANITSSDYVQALGSLPGIVRTANSICLGTDSSQYPRLQLSTDPSTGMTFMDFMRTNIVSESYRGRISYFMGNDTLYFYCAASGSPSMTLNNTGLTLSNNINVTGTGNFSNNLTINSPGILSTSNTEASSSPVTGAIRSAGGIYTGNSNYFNSNTTNTGTLTVSNTTPGTLSGGALYLPSGGVSVGGNSYFANNLTIAKDVSVQSATNSTTTSTGALVVSGGLGVGANVNIGGNTRVSASTISSSTTTGALQIVGGVGIQNNTYIGGTLNVTGLSSLGSATLSSTTDATSLTTGSLHTEGGFSAKLNMYGGSDLFLSGMLRSTSAAPSVSTTTPNYTVSVTPTSTNTCGCILVTNVSNTTDYLFTVNVTPAVTLSSNYIVIVSPAFGTYFNISQPAYFATKFIGNVWVLSVKSMTNTPIPVSSGQNYAFNYFISQ